MVTVRGKVVTIEIDTAEAATESPVPLEHDLRIRFEFRRKYEAGHRGDARRVECLDQLFQPARMHRDVIVGVDDDLSAGGTGTAVTGDVQTGPVFAHVVHASRQRDRAGRFIA